MNIIATDQLELSQKLSLPLIQDHDQNYRFVITNNNDTLVIIDKYQPRSQPFYIDFTDLSYQRRLIDNQLPNLIKACGLKKNPHRQLLDLTGGWLVDSYLLAAYAPSITVLECNPIIHAMVTDGIGRAKQKTDPLIEKIHYQLIDAAEFLTICQQQQLYYDIIYFDPMFEQTLKGTVKKPSQILQLLANHQQNLTSLALLASSCCKYRLVIKRGKGCKSLLPQPVTFTLTAKNTRFDVYDFGTVVG